MLDKNVQITLNIRQPLQQNDPGRILVIIEILNYIFSNLSDIIRFIKMIKNFGYKHVHIFNQHCFLWCLSTISSWTSAAMWCINLGPLYMHVHYFKVCHFIEYKPDFGHSNIPYILFSLMRTNFCWKSCMTCWGFAEAKAAAIIMEIINQFMLVSHPVRMSLLKMVAIPWWQVSEINGSVNMEQNEPDHIYQPRLSQCI